MTELAIRESADSRAIGLRMRPDLEMRLQSHGGDRYWAVKDPIALKYFHLRDEERFLLTMLDGQTSLDEIRRRFDETFAPRSLDLARVHGFLAKMHRCGLLLADSPGQAEQLLIRRDDELKRRRHQRLTGLLAIRFRGLNPRGVLDWLAPKCRFFFSPWCVAAALLLAVAALVLVTVEFDTFRSRLPELRAIVSASNLPWLAVALAGTKILHELGHALACRYYGGDCHEIGLMLLVFTPSLYCNVSDSWMLDSKWQRMAVAAAGMYVELVLASICTFLWWTSEPGVFNSLCLDVVLVCSVGTVLFNGNPLLRYDGYFILSDFLEIPNLSAEATAALRRRLARWCLGWRVVADRASAPRRQVLLVGYAIVSTIYRWAVVIAVLWALNALARPYHLEVLVVMLGGVVALGMALPTVAAIAHWARNPLRDRRVAPLRAALAGLVVVAAVLAVALVPVATRVAAPVVVEYRDAQRVYVTVPGMLARGVSTGDTVERGQTLAQLTNDSVRRDVAKATAERNEQRIFLANLESRHLQGTIDGAQIPAAKAALADAQQRLDQLEHDAARLTIVAPESGTVLPPPAVPRQPRVADKLDRWSGAPLDPRNEGTYLDVGTLLCLVGDPERFEAVLHVEQTDIELVAPGQQARIVLDHLPGEVYWGTVVEIAKVDLKVMPRELMAAGDLPARVDQRGVSHPLDTWYQARVTFDHDPRHLVAGVHGQAKIVVARQSLGAQLVRYLKQTFSRPGAPRR